MSKGQGGPEILKSCRLPETSTAVGILQRPSSLERYDRGISGNNALFYLSRLQCGTFPHDKCIPGYQGPLDPSV